MEIRVFLQFDKMKTKFLLLFFLLILGFSAFSFGQEKSASEKKDSIVAKKDSKKIATSPFHWSKKEWIGASVVVGGGILLYAFDDDIQKLVLRNKGTQTNLYLGYVFDPLGSGLY